ncbi:ATP-binding cassette domain-containing protein [Nonomuraea sp. NPDC047529]|uniref:ATP-binding cassette domain-containing protein n=1 Tax=Nonomuraea sp. NPDC047529 TaxID=3155623 RepID=UPI0033C790A0
MIEVTDLTKLYGSTRAVSRLTFDVKPGQVTGFLGHNGAGKSTTMRMILGLHTPTSGKALINGVRKHDLRDPMREVGAMLDAAEVQGGRSAFAHLQALAHAGGIGRRRVVEVLEEVGLAGAARKRIAGFSQGMRQRLGIAAALLGDPGVLILDEPVNGLDPDGIRWLRTLLRSLAAEGRTVLLSSHLMTEMSLTADRLIIIGQGRLIEDTSTADLLARFQSGVLVRSPHAARLSRALEAAGATIHPAQDTDTDEEPVPGRPAAAGVDTRPVRDARAGEELLVTGLTAAAIGDIALANGCAVHELVSRRTSLEEAFMEITQ